MAYSTDAQWFEINVDTLSVEQRGAYDAYKALYREMKAQREAFEASMQAGVPEGLRMVFGYRFGKLSVAIVPDDRKPAKAKASTQSLADFLASQAERGAASPTHQRPQEREPRAIGWRSCTEIDRHPPTSSSEGPDIPPTFP